MTAPAPVTRTRLTAERSTGVPEYQGKTIVDALRANRRRRPHWPAMRTRTDAGEWQVTTWTQYAKAVDEIAAGLICLGVNSGDRVAILSNNRPEWHLADIATMAVGAVTVPVYPTSSPAQIEYTLGHSGAVVCFLDSHAQLSKLFEVQEELPGLRHVVLTDRARRAGDTWVIGFDELQALGADTLADRPTLVEERSLAILPDDLATIVYTSGTTGPPKGAMISHSNIMWTIRSVAPLYEVGETDRFLSFLPLSHIAERMMSDFTPIAVTGETWFARSLATVAEDLPACRPTIFLAVPRVWEKLRDGIQEQIAKQPRAVRMVIEHYISLGLRAVNADQEGVAMPAPHAASYSALDRFIGTGIRRQAGLDRARLLVTAAAPTHPDLIKWFHAIGLPIYQIYGQTEDCGPTTANPPGDRRIGSVGKPLPGVSVNIADDGEILVKGGNVCQGYLSDPKATRELIDPDGWMHSGDTGRFDEEGSLHIVGRKKDLIITAAGKNIAPQDMETELGNFPLISQAVVVGEGRKFLSALITLDAESVTNWARDRNKLDDMEALAADPDLLREIRHAVDEVNARRSHAEGIRQFRVLAHDLTAAAGELTPTMKVKRQVVHDHYAAVIDEIYGGS